jgi:hypothetical protein
MKLVSRILLIMLALALAGCAYYDPMMQLEATTPMLEADQLAELQRRAKTPEALGIGVVRQGGFTWFRGVNEVSVSGTVTARLSRVETAHPFQPGGRYRVPVVLATVNGHGGVRVMLDSGSNQSLCGYGLARGLELTPIAGLNAMNSHGIGGSVDTLPSVADSLRIGGVEIRKLVTMINPDVQALRVREFWGTSRVFLMGVNIFRGLSYLTIDSPRGFVVFGVGEAYRPDKTSEFVADAPLSWQNDLPCIPLKIDKKGPFACLVDTGGDYGLLLPRARASGLGYWKPGEGKVEPSTGVAGAGLSVTYDVKTAHVGAMAVLNIPSRTIVVGPEPAGGATLIGNHVLRRYRITFDFRNQRFWMERRES